jgi:hypothetical protein
MMFKRTVVAIAAAAADYIAMAGRFRTAADPDQYPAFEQMARSLKLPD